MLGSDTMEPQHIDRLVYTRAVLDEAMRLYPPAPFLSRAAIAEDAVGDLRIEAGTLVTIAPYVLHRHQTLWDEPRFLPTGTVPPRSAEFDRPIRLSAIRRRTAGLYRRKFRLAGGGDRARQHRPCGPP